MNRVIFFQWALDQLQNSNSSFRCILFTDEATFISNLKGRLCKIVSQLLTQQLGSIIYYIALREHLVTR